MILQADSTLFDQGLDGINDTVKQVHHGPPTPYQVSKWLPAGYTPDQLDSAIHKHCKISEIRWSSKPDTLHLPGEPKPHDPLQVVLPKYDEEGFFSKDSLYRPELKGGQMGVMGDPVPYTIPGDNLITSVLLGCFIMATIAFSQSQRFLIRQAKNFFYEPHFGTTEVTETSSELRYQLFFVLQSCLLFGIIYFFWTKTKIDTFIIEQYSVIGIYAGAVAVYYLLKAILYSVVDSVFFGNKKNEQWMKSYLFLISTQGLLLFPVVLLMAFFGLSESGAALYALFVIILTKLLSFYKCYIIFFKKLGNFLQNILYFCALEVMPLGALLGFLMTIGNYLKINY